MSTGAVFKLIANDGKADRMIMATKLLNQRIKDVMCARKQAGKSDQTPTLVDIERTHILYVNAHFKPFAALGFEYNKVRPQSGNPQLGAGVTFSIPQFGDFFHDMVCRVRLSHFSGLVGTTPAITAATATTSPLFPVDGMIGGSTVTTNPVFYNIVDAFGGIVKAGGAASTTTTQYRNFVYYCDFPGNRLFSSVKFDVNGNPLDQYDSLVTLMLEKFCVAPNKRIGHNRLLGQEVPITGYGGVRECPVSDADPLTEPNKISRDTAGQSNQTVALFNDVIVGGTTGAPPAAVISALTNTQTQVDMSRKVLQFANGPQTPKLVQPPLEIWNKLRFWFNEDVRLSVPSVSIPFGQRFITIELAQQSLLAYEYPSIYLETIKETLLSGAGTSATLTGSVVREKSYTPLFNKNGTTDIAVEKLELYINNIFVNPEIHDIFIKRIGFSLIRVYREQVSRVNTESDEKLLSNLKWPIEYMFCGMRPAWNIKDVVTNTFVVTGNQNVGSDWHKLTRQIDAFAGEISVAEVPTASASYTGTNPQPVVASTGTFGNLSNIARLSSSINQVVQDKYSLSVSTVDTLSLKSHGITIFDSFNDTFFNQYMPYHYGGANLNTPEDTGALLINMALYPRAYQPSGHINISRARETFIGWTSSYISSNTPADLIVVAVAINFLLITDGSAILRYST